jgi:hypothetical protein
LLLHALRERIGDAAFFRLLQEWTSRYRHGNANTDDFIALAEEIAAEDLEPFFTEWLETPWTPERVAELALEGAQPAPDALAGAVASDESESRSQKRPRGLK